MTFRINQPVSSPDHGGVIPYNPAFGQPGMASPATEPEGIPWGRYIDALRRHALLIVAIVVLGTVLGKLAAQRAEPSYDVQATVWIASGYSQQSGPIRPQQLLPSTSWVELLRSYSIVDAVVRKLRLNVHYKGADSVFFADFESLPNLKPGAYVLTAQAGGRYTLSAGKDIVIERGTLGDSIGRNLGFGWAPRAELFRPGRVVSFSVSTPRGTSGWLLGSLRTQMPEDGQFLTITLTGSDPNRAAATLNAWVEEFVNSSGDLKKRHLLEFKKILSDQLALAENQLRGSEGELQRFREKTITLPNGGGGQAAPDQSVGGYFQQKSALVDVVTERQALEQLLANAKGAPINPQSFLTIPGVLTDAPQLRAAIDELSSRQASLRSEQQFLTDANPRIKQLNETVRALQYETIPQIVRGVVQALSVRERDLNSRLQSQTAELRGIPSRAIEEARLARQVTASDNLYSVLKARYEEVTLQEAQTTPDLSVLDYAMPASHPNSNDAPRLLLLAIVASIGFAVGLALLHDRVDRRFRYPEQATNDLGLAIAGTVPRLRAKRDGVFQVEQMSQVVEAFRTLRLAVRYEFPTDGPVVLAVSSPSSGDGKSLVSANLALAFASAGHRTLLIDGDLRRGGLHSTFDMPVTPGLVEYLSNGLGIDAVVKKTNTENLFLLARGTRVARAPELLVSDRMHGLIQLTREKFDAVIIDSPPFVAGVDAYALSAAAGSILVVLRQGFSDRKLAAAKLTVLDRLPIRFLGAVINGVPAGGMYRYYGTDYSQADAFGKPVGSLATPRGLVAGA